MKILIDIRPLTKDWYSGIANYTRSLVDEFLALNNGNKSSQLFEAQRQKSLKDKYQLFYNGWKKNALPEAWLKSEKVELINWRLPNKLLDLSNRFLREPKIDRFFGPDLIFSPHFNLLNRKNTPRVLTIHDLSFVRHRQFFTPQKRFWHWLQDARSQIKNADRLIAISEFTKSDIMDYFKVPAEKISVVYSGISGKFRRLSELNEDLNNFKKSRFADNPFILYLGALEPRKNIISLVRVFNILKKETFYKNWRLVLAGGSRWLAGDLDREIKNSSYAGDVMVLEKITEEDKIFLYNSAKVFVYPSFFEGFGFPPLEAQACGLPVAASNRASLPEILGESAYLFDPWHLEEIYESIKILTQDSAAREKMIRLGVANAAKFSWQKTAKETLKIFSETI
jgi:glycosyltransferase involved in cell wall biosynthesis